MNSFLRSLPKRIALYGACALLPFTTIAQTVIPLYFPDSIPNSIPAPNQEERKTDDKGALLATKISPPTLPLYLPHHPHNDVPAVVICPGGGYWVNALNIEGYD